MVKFAKQIGLIMVLAGWPLAGFGQSISAADLRAMVDEKIGGLDEYAELLNDPDPERSLAAMTIMIGLDDPQINRMALQHGLTSTSPAVRRAALKAYFDTGPNLDIYIDGSSLDRDDLTTYISNRYGTVDENGIAYLTYKVGEFDKAENCYDFQSAPNYCLIRLTEDSASIGLWQKWSPMKLTAEGVLSGFIQVDRITPAVPATIPIRP